MATKVKDIPADITFPDVSIQLSGQDGNVFFIIGRCKQAIRRAHGADAAEKWYSYFMEKGEQDGWVYDDVLFFCTSTLDVG